jgi:hypothetical protein
MTKHAAGEALRERRADARHLLHHAFDLAGHALARREVRAGNLYAERAPDAGGQDCKLTPPARDRLRQVK